jgi:hypothetical protein
MSFFIAATLLCTMTVGSLRRLQELARLGGRLAPVRAAAWQASALFASDEGGEPGGPAVRVQIDTRRQRRTCQRRWSL